MVKVLRAKANKMTKGKGKHKCPTCKYKAIEIGPGLISLYTKFSNLNWEVVFFFFF